MVVEVASNDGYLLRNFVAAGVRCSASSRPPTSPRRAIAAGVPTEVAFFGARAALRASSHAGSPPTSSSRTTCSPTCPTSTTSSRGSPTVLKPDGVLTVEVPHLLRMIERTEFDTIYHEHFSYFSLLAARTCSRARGLRVFDVEELPTHGGSLRIWASRDEAPSAWPETPAVERVLDAERAAGLDDRRRLRRRSPRASRRVLGDLRAFLREARARGARVAAYGAAAKGNTLLNAAGVGTDDDRATSSTAARTSRAASCPARTCPILAPDHVRRDRPDYLLLLPWNLRDEITEQMADVREWGCRFVVPVPRVEVAGVIFREQAIGGVFTVERRAGPRRARLLRPHVRPCDEFAEHGHPARGRAGERLVQRAARHAARHAPPGGRRTRRRSSCAASPARSTTWSSTCAPARRRSCEWLAVELSAERRNALYVPPGLAHGFLTLEDDTELEYLISTPYAPAAAAGVRWDDPASASSGPLCRS